MVYHLLLGDPVARPVRKGGEDVLARAGDPCASERGRTCVSVCARERQTIIDTTREREIVSLTRERYFVARPGGPLRVRVYGLSCIDRQVS